MLIRITAAAWALALPAFAQHAGHAMPGPASAPTHAASAPAGNAGASSYQSVFTGYRRFADEPTQDWKAANERVARIGGWRAYAAEVSGAHAGHGTAGPTPASAPSPAQPASSPVAKSQPGHAHHH
jgi:hypothetical protein